MLTTTKIQFAILTVLTALVVLAGACSDDSGGNGASNNGNLDVSTDTADASGVDAADTTDTDTGDSEGSDDGIATGEECPSDCQVGGELRAGLCEGCEANRCLSPDDTDQQTDYCTIQCAGDSDCEQFGDGWYCNLFDVCAHD